MSVWYDKQPLHAFHITAVRYFGDLLGVEIVKLVKPHVCTVSNLGLLYAQYLMLCGFLCFGLFKFPNTTLRFINVGVGAHCLPSCTIFISHSAEVAKTQHQNFANFGISIQKNLLIINN